MAEGFDEHYYHVPQQTRRDKLRVFPLNQLGFVESSSTLHPSCSTLPSLFDPSLIPSDLLPCATQQGVSKEEGSSLMMGFVEGGVMNGDAIHAINNTSSSNNNNPFLYQLQNFREFNTNSYNDGSEMTVFKPKPLSLSLSSNDNNTHHPLELNLQRYGGVIPSLDGGNSEVSRNSVPLGPFTGYASILKGSRFLRPAQQLLEELCDVGVRGIYATDKIIAPDASLMEPPHEGLSASGIVGGVDPLGDYGNEGWKKKCRLLTMLEEVYRRYRQYYQQIHAVITSFEYVSGLGNASPYASLAINSMSKHYRCLKNAIIDQLQFINKTPIQMSNRKDESPRLQNSNMGTYSQRPGFLEHQQQPIWRPQRGLPERAVSVLRTWLFEHFLHPYPTDTDKLMLAKQTGLSRNQVSNWFINARVRLWKPMVEEIHILESQQQGQKRPHTEEQSRKNLSDHVPSNNSHVAKNPSTSMDKFHNAPDKQARNEHVNVQLRGEGQLNQSNTSINQQVGVGMSTGSNGASNNNNSVSLTLGLHQNHGIGFSEPFSMSAAQRFGVALQPEGYVLNGFESQSRHFGRDVIGGVQLLHDFVG